MKWAAAPPQRAKGRGEQKFYSSLGGQAFAKNAMVYSCVNFLSSLPDFMHTEAENIFGHMLKVSPTWGFKKAFVSSLKVGEGEERTYGERERGGG